VIQHIYAVDESTGEEKLDDKEVVDGQFGQHAAHLTRPVRRLRPTYITQLPKHNWKRKQSYDVQSHAAAATIAANARHVVVTVFVTL